MKFTNCSCIDKYNVNYFVALLCSVILISMIFLFLRNILDLQMKIYDYIYYLIVSTLEPQLFDKIL